MRRVEKHREAGQFLGRTEASHWNFIRGELVATLRIVFAAYLLAHDFPGRQTIHGDAVLADFIR